MNGTQIKNFIPQKWSNKFAWEVLPDGAWQGHPCFIIGGGPSLTHFNWEQLQGRLTIGINRVYEKWDPTIIFGMDPKFVRWILMGKYGDIARRKFLQSPALKIWLCTHPKHLPGKIYVLKCWKSYLDARRAFPFTMRDGIGHGNNSGYAALNLAACLGADPIYLLGYDMQVEGKQTHWHNGHPQAAPDHVPASFIEHFNAAAVELKKRDVTVINLSSNSALKCFPTMNPAKAFAELPPPQAQLATQSPATGRETAKFGPILKPLPPPKGVLAKKLLEKLPDLFITGPGGFGDTFHLRSIVRALANRYTNIYVRTALPEAFWDIENVKFVRPTTNKLRAQKEHVEYLDKAKGHKWTKPPDGTAHHSWASLAPSWRHQTNKPNSVAVPVNPRGEESTTKYFINEHGIDSIDYSFPLKKAWVKEAEKIIGSLNLQGKKLCIVRPPSIRKDWANYARNPKPEYFQLLIDKYKKDYFFVTAGNNQHNQEWYVGTAPRGINKKYDHGELALTTLFALIKLADMIITPPDFFSMLAIAMRTKCFCIFGGCAKPSIIFDEKMGLENFTHVAPNPFCNCVRMEHNCNKEIPEAEIVQKFDELRLQVKQGKTVSVGIPPGVGDMHWVLAKLESFKEKNCIDKLKIVIDRNPTLNYSRDFLRMVPFIDEVDDGQKHLPFKFSIAGGDGTPLQCNVNGVNYLMEFNSMLEQGVRLEQILPEYDTNFNYPINNPPAAKDFATLIKKGLGGKLYLFYASSIGGNKNWCKGTWETKDWVKLADLIYAATKRKIVLMGAQWDTGYAAMIKSYDVLGNIHSFVGKTSISEALALLREAKFMVSFLSGLAILATRFKLPCVSFWPTLKQAPHWHDPKKFQHAWPPPNAQQDGYMPMFYGAPQTTPEGVFTKLRKYL